MPQVVRALCPAMLVVHSGTHTANGCDQQCLVPREKSESGLSVRAMSPSRPVKLVSDRPSLSGNTSQPIQLLRLIPRVI